MSGTMETFCLPGGIRLTGPGAASSQPPQRATGRTGTWLPSLTSMPVGSAFSQGLPARQGPQFAGFSYLTGPPSGCFAPTPSRLSPQAGSSARPSPAHAAPDPAASMTANAISIWDTEWTSPRSHSASDCGSQNLPQAGADSMHDGAEPRGSATRGSTTGHVSGFECY